MPQGNGAGARLDSWKDIASYLRRDVRTVIRWEKEKGLPVRRVPGGGRRKAVFAYTAELESWLRTEDSEEVSLAPPGELVIVRQETSDKPTAAFGAGLATGKFEGKYLTGAIATTVLLVLGGLSLRPREPAAGVPVRVGFTLNALQVFDGNNRQLWSHTFSGMLEPGVIGRKFVLSDTAFIGDFRGKGDQEVLIVAPVRLGLNLADGIGMEVDLFSSRGDMLWSYVPQERFQFGKHEITGPWCPGTLFVTSHGGKKQIWAAALNLVWGNSFVVNLDPETGKDRLRFVNTGTIHALNEVKMGQRFFLLVGGFNNEPDTGSLAVMDEAKNFAASPQGEGTRHKCVSCAAGDPDFYFVFPRSEINELEEFHEDGVVEVQVQGDKIEVRKKEWDSDVQPQSVYELEADRGVVPVTVRFESTYDMLHRKLEAEGRLDHTLEKCSERLHPRTIKVWTPGEGWREMGPSGASD